MMLAAKNKTRKRKATNSTELRGGKKEKKSAPPQKKRTHTDIWKLIEFYENKPCLWDITDKSYHLRDVREQTQNEIAVGLDATISKVKGKM